MKHTDQVVVNMDYYSNKIIAIHVEALNLKKEYEF